MSSHALAGLASVNRAALRWFERGLEGRGALGANPGIRIAAGDVPAGHDRGCPREALYIFGRALA